MSRLKKADDNSSSAFLFAAVVFDSSKWMYSRKSPDGIYELFRRVSGGRRFPVSSYRKSIKNKDMEKERIVVKKTFDGFTATTESNHNAMVQDEHKIWKFDKSEGFNEFSDVREYIVKWFHTEDIVLVE